jgi:hypothetical protein
VLSSELDALSRRGAMLCGVCVLPVGLAAAPSASLARHPLRPTTASARWAPPTRCAFIGDRFLEGMPSYATQGSNPGLAESRQICYSHVLRAPPLAGRLGGRRAASTS